MQRNSRTIEITIESLRDKKRHQQLIGEILYAESCTRKECIDKKQSIDRLPSGRYFLTFDDRPYIVDIQFDLVLSDDKTSQYHVGPIYDVVGHKTDSEIEIDAAPEQVDAYVLLLDNRSSKAKHHHFRAVPLTERLNLAVDNTASESSPTASADEADLHSSSPSSSSEANIDNDSNEIEVVIDMQSLRENELHAKLMGEIILQASREEGRYFQRKLLPVENLPARMKDVSDPYQVALPKTYRASDQLLPPQPYRVYTTFDMRKREPNEEVKTDIIYDISERGEEVSAQEAFAACSYNQGKNVIIVPLSERNTQPDPVPTTNEPNYDYTWDIVRYVAYATLIIIPPFTPFVLGCIVGEFGGKLVEKIENKTNVFSSIGDAIEKKTHLFSTIKKIDQSISAKIEKKTGLISTYNKFFSSKATQEEKRRKKGKEKLKDGEKEISSRENSYTG